MKRLAKDEYNKFCHNTKNALLCIGFSTRKIEKLLENIDTDLTTADELLMCMNIIKKESQRMINALSESSRIWKEVAEDLIKIELEECNNCK